MGSSALKTNMEAVATCSDAEFMLRVKDGDEECFAYLLSKHRGPIVYYLCRMVKNSAVAEELAQDVFLRVYRARQNYEPTAKFTTWLYEIATNVAFNSLRDGKHARNTDPLDDGEDGRVREIRVLADAPDLLNDGLLDVIRRNGFGRARLPSLLLSRQTDIITIPPRPLGGIRMDHWLVTGLAEEQATQKCPVLVTHFLSAGKTVITKKFVDPVPNLGLKDGRVFTGIDYALVVDMT